MSRLTIVTDHRYFVSGTRVVDTYCFDRPFFDDYRAVFDEVTVAARIRSDRPPPGARHADGDGVSFVKLPDLRGAYWPAAAWLRGLPSLRVAIASSDAVCLRIPSTACHLGFRYAVAERKPMMFEMIGHPVESWRGQARNPLAYIFSTLDSRMAKRIIAGSTVGSYVSSEYLQRDYPAPEGTVTDAVSSIRLGDSDLLGPRCYKTSSGPLRLVYVASLVPVKSHATLLKALALVHDRGGHCRLSLIGDGTSRLALTRLCDDLGLSELVQFHGHISDRAALLRLLDESDLFVMTSLSEGLPRSMLEGMARGLPAVGTSVGGISELISAEQQFPAGDAAALSTLLARIEQDRGILSRWSEKGFETTKGFRQTILSGKRQKLLRLLRARSLAARDE